MNLEHAQDPRATYYSAEWQRARTRLPSALSWLEDGFRDRQHVGIQLVLRLDEQEQLSLSAGRSTPDTLMSDAALGVLLCASKPMIAAAAVRAMDRSMLALTDPVSRYVPELRDTSLSGITFLECLSHSIGGVDPSVDYDTVPMGLPIDEAFDVVLKTVARAEGRHRAGSHYLSWPFVLVGVALERVFEADLSSVMRTEVFTPLGMSDSWLGMPPEVERAYRDADRIAHLFSCPDRGEPAVIPAYGADSSTLHRALPVVGVRAPAVDIAAFYRALLLAREGRDNTWLSQGAALAMTARHRVGLPEPSGAMIDFGVGVELESRHYDKFWMSYGPHCSLNTFGHKGESCFLGLCDPRERLVLAVFVNGVIEGMAHGRRMFNLAKRIYEDLGLVD